MSLSMINFKATNTEVRDQLKNLLEQKLQTLNRFIGEDSVICDAEFEKVTSQQQGPVHRVEVNLEVSGKLYRAEATMDSFEMAIDEVRDELDKELRRASDKKETMLKRGGRRLKEMLRFGDSN